MPSSDGAGGPGAPRLGRRRPACCCRRPAAPLATPSAQQLQDAPLPRRRAGLLLPLGRGVALVQAHGDARHFGWFHGVKGTVWGAHSAFWARPCCAGQHGQLCAVRPPKRRDC